MYKMSGVHVVLLFFWGRDKIIAYMLSSFIPNCVDEFPQMITVEGKFELWSLGFNY